jgi:hypothetical protein
MLCCGFDCLFPGKPVTFATIETLGNSAEGEERTRKLLIFSLPGNPASAMVCFHLFVAPAIRKLSGMENVEGPRLTVVVSAVSLSLPFRRSFFGVSSLCLSVSGFPVSSSLSLSLLSVSLSPPVFERLLVIYIGFLCRPRNPWCWTRSASSIIAQCCVRIVCLCHCLVLCTLFTLGSAYANSLCGCRGYHPGEEHRQPNELKVPFLLLLLASVLAHQLHRLLSMRSANGLLVLPQRHGTLPAGSSVEAILIGQLL